MAILVHAFSTLDGDYLYDANTSSILRVPKAIHDAFKNDSVSDLSAEDQRTIENIRNAGMLQDAQITKIEHPFSSRLNSLLERRVESITLQLTQQCNLRCKYCVYSGIYNTRTHSSRLMPLDIAEKCVDFLIAHSVDLDVVTINFYGGEPLLRFDAIKKTVNYAQSVGEGKKIRFGMTTNGTLFTDEILTFLEKNNFDLLLSLDGPKEVHDANRVFASNGQGSFDTIMTWIARIKKNFPILYKKISINAVIDPKLDSSCSNSFFIDCESLEGANVTGNLIGDTYKKEEAETSEKFFVKYEEEYFKVLMNKLGVISDKNISKIVYFKFTNILTQLFVFRTKARGIAASNHPSGPCIPGCRKLFVDVDGNFFPCENVSEHSSRMAIGNINDGFNEDAARTILNIGRISEDECKKCWAFRLCTQCAVYADDGSTLSRELRLSRCDRDKYSLEEDLKDYCALVELGFEFQGQVDKDRGLTGEFNE